MNTLLFVALWAAIGGIALCVVLRRTLDGEGMRAKVEKACLIFGGVGAVLMLAPLVVGTERAGLLQARAALGLLAGIPLVAGVVMRIARMRAGP